MVASCFCVACLLATDYFYEGACTSLTEFCMLLTENFEPVIKFDEGPIARLESQGLMTGVESFLHSEVGICLCIRCFLPEDKPCGRGVWLVGRIDEVCGLAGAQSIAVLVWGHPR